MSKLMFTSTNLLKIIVYRLPTAEVNFLYVSFQ